VSLEDKFKQGEQAAEKLEQQAEKEIIKAYRESLKEIRAELALAYEKYAIAGALTMAEMMKYGRLVKLEAAIAKEVSKLNGTGARTTKKTIKKVFQESYYRSAWALETGAEVSLSFTLLKPQAVEAAILNPYDLITWPERIKDNARLLVRQIREEISRGIVQGYSYDKTARAVKERLDIGASKAIRIVQTETHRAQSQGTQTAFEEAAEKGLVFKRVWISTLDGRTRDRHRALDGQKAEADQPFKMDGMTAMYPGGFGIASMDINCFPGDMCVYSESPIEGATKRWYEGELIEIKTTTGVIVAGTPNHPILTEQGWLPLNLVAKGCNVVCCAIAEPITASNPYPYNRPTAFGKAFSLTDIVGTVSKQRARGVNPQFHGDGFNSDVDIIFLKSKLDNRVKPALPKHLSQDQLSLAELREGDLLGDSTFGHFPSSSLSPSDGTMSGGSESAAFFGGGVRHSDKHSLATIAATDVMFLQDAANNRSANIEGLCKSLFGSSSEISFDNVIAVNVRKFSGHVYNLQTSNSVYITNAIVPQKVQKFKGAVAHNCRCTVRAEIEGMSPTLRRARDEKTGKNVVISNITYQEWYNNTVK
jgi:SPP1 gp7 family putative phage head morphogenesis protein